MTHENLIADPAAEALDSGDWFDSPPKAEEAYDAAKTKTPEPEPVAELERASTAIHPSQMDKRTKEYKAWLSTQREDEE